MQQLENLDIFKKISHGKVRDIYDLGDTLLLVTSDRISAYDAVFPTLIPGKGILLNKISAHFFAHTKDIVPNHFISDNPAEYPNPLPEYTELLTGRSMLVQKTRVIPFECIVRGYITGSAWAEYKDKGDFAGLGLPADMQESQAFPQPVFTPSTKAEEGHDMNISYADMCRQMDPVLAEKIKNTAIALYNFGHDFYRSRGLILADTKFEFGTKNGQLYLIDEAFTPDSSRLWDAEDYKPGTTPKSYDKQYVRDYVTAAGWSKQPPAPSLPGDVVDKTREKYQSVLDLINRG